MADRVRPRHFAEAKPLGHGVGSPDLLVDLHAPAGAHHGNLRGDLRQRLARRGLLTRRHRHHRVRVVNDELELLVDGLAERLGEPLMIGLRVSAQGELDAALALAPVHGKSRRIRTPLAHGDEHALEHLAQFALELRVLQEETHDPAHAA